MVSSFPVAMIRSSDGPRPIPVIGMGTAVSKEAAGNEVTAGIVEAIKVGYRHFDTATLYKSEPYLGEAIKEALKLGLIKSREELFITTKLWCNSADAHLVLPAINQSLRNLGLEYVDLYLIHWPLTLKQEEVKIPIPKEAIFLPINLKEVWKAMEDCQNFGLAKSIGVSNFSPNKIQEILSFAKIPPAINQVEMNPFWQQKKLNEFCKKNGILLTGYSPLGGFGKAWGHNRVMECDVLKHIANSKGKTVAQICLRWIYEQGVSFVVQSFNKERMKQNLDVFDWSLTEQELIEISQIPQQKNTYLRLIVIEPNDVTAEIDEELSFQ